MNGWNLAATEDAAYATVLDVARGITQKDEVADWLRRNARARVSFELRDFFQRLDYATLATVFGAIAAGDASERFATIIEAGQAIPAISQANVSAMAAEDSTEVASSQILRQHSMLLTAIYRIAEEMGYEW